MKESKDDVYQKAIEVRKRYLGNRGDSCHVGDCQELSLRVAAESGGQAVGGIFLFDHHLPARIPPHQRRQWAFHVWAIYDDGNLLDGSIDQFEDPMQGDFTAKTQTHGIYYSKVDGPGLRKHYYKYAVQDPDHEDRFYKLQRSDKSFNILDYIDNPQWFVPS